MSLLDHKIPPPIVGLVCAGLAWTIARYLPDAGYASPYRTWIALALAVAGISLDLSGLVVFRKARTTINPLSPDKSTAIVQAGPYAFTRNPMYVGMALILLGYCVYLANAVSLVAVAIFCAYITAFQIIPEERLLLRKFGDSYARYMQAVRRWI
ncbi:isoprenylcysteine carboxylmethyltransferase family protein [Arenimonas sp.]|uniref:methyltransferase family protein n=1 Tax=Arenimonas sp. TaxID=1872635 RepID=UPI0035AE6039